jgi:hypothetical protein
MNPEEARLILQCRRPQRQDDALPADLSTPLPASTHG